MKFVVYKDKKNEWRWTLKARNGKVVADGGEGYKKRGGATRAVRTLFNGTGLDALQTTYDKFYESEEGLDG